TTGTAIRRTTTVSTATISTTVGTATATIGTTASATVGVPAAALTRVGLRGREHREQLHRRPVHGAVRGAGAHVPALLPRLGERPGGREDRPGGHRFERGDLVRAEHFCGERVRAERPHRGLD